MVCLYKKHKKLYATVANQRMKMVIELDSSSTGADLTFEGDELTAGPGKRRQKSKDGVEHLDRE